MPSRIALLLVFGNLSWIYSMGQVKDTLYLRNGQILVGELKKIELGIIQFDDDDLKILNIKINKVTGMSATKNIYKITTVSDREYLGTIHPSVNPRYVNFHITGDTITLFMDDISELNFINERFLQSLDGSLTLGYNYTRSSDIGRFNFDTQTSYKSERIGVELTSSVINTREEDTTYRERGNITLALNYYLNPAWYAIALASYQRNLELGIYRRLQEGLGIANNFVLRQHMKASIGLGVVLNQEFNADLTPSGSLVEIPLILQWNFFKFSDPNIQLSTSQVFYTSASQKGRFRLDGETRATWKVIQDLALTVTCYNNYDSQPPTENASKFDFGVVIGVSYIY